MDKLNLGGSLIVLEGGDASGKGTQIAALSRKIEALGYDVTVYDFPRYGEFFGSQVGRMLRGEFGPLGSIHPFLAATLYANDRAEVADEIWSVVSGGGVALCNRYVASNLAHGAAKFRDWDDALAFMKLVERMEYEVNLLPLPQLQLFLDVPTESSRRMLAMKGEREYIGGAGVDLAEADMGHQEKARAVYRWLCENRPGYVRVECGLDDGGVKTIEEVEKLIWTEVVSRF